jgi:hypothetical protein
MIQPIIYGSSDEEEHEYDDIQSNSTDNIGSRNSHDGENLDRENVDNKSSRVGYYDDYSGFGGFDGISSRIEEEEIYRERERFGEETNEILENILDDLNGIQEAIVDVIKLSFGHQHRTEIPRASLQNTETRKRWADRGMALQHARVLPTTFGRNGRGNIFPPG